MSADNRTWEGDGDSAGDATDDGSKAKKDPRKAQDSRDRARTVPQKQDEQDAVGSPDRRTLRDVYRRPLRGAKTGAQQGPGHSKRKGKNNR
jgi:hypothetical protein